MFKTRESINLHAPSSIHMEILPIFQEASLFFLNLLKKETSILLSTTTRDMEPQRANKQQNNLSVLIYS